MSEITVHLGDSRDVLKTLADNSIDSVVTDPPYALVSIGKRFGADNAAPAKAGKSGAYMRASAGFMGKKWDTGETAFAVEFWAEVMRVLKPGGHVVAFSGTRTYHRLACAVEDAGFEIRDMVAWLYGSGFPKSHDVSKGIDKAAGAVREKVRVEASQVRNHKATGGGRDGMKGASSPFIEAAMKSGFHEMDGAEPITEAARQWQGWGTALKPALEPIVLARKPLTGTVAANVLAHGTGALNIDASRVGWQSEADAAKAACAGTGFSDSRARGTLKQSFSLGKESRDKANTYDTSQITGRWPANVIHDGSEEVVGAFPAAASRFFYTAKADATERLGTEHPTVKPTDLMAYLIRLVTPPGGTTLDPFAGSGSTGVAAVFGGFSAVLIEREPEYHADILRRIAWAKGEGGLTATERRIPAVKPLHGDLFADQLPPPVTGRRGRQIYGVFADEKSDQQD